MSIRRQVVWFTGTLLVVGIGYVGFVVYQIKTMDEEVFGRGIAEAVMALFVGPLMGRQESWSIDVSVRPPRGVHLPGILTIPRPEPGDSTRKPFIVSLGAAFQMGDSHSWEGLCVRRFTLDSLTLVDQGLPMRPAVGDSIEKPVVTLKSDSTVIATLSNCPR